MLNELDILLDSIEKQYKNLNLEWQKNKLYFPLHQKKNLVKDIKSNNQILNTILDYCQFLNENHLDLKIALSI